MKKCGDCVHVSACELWNMGTMENTKADNCTLYETVEETSAYYLGLCAGAGIKWIPVTERLPEEYEEEINVYDDLMNVKGMIKRTSSNRCLVTIEEKRYLPHIGFSFTVDGKFPDRVTAWMPLPEPYKEDKE